MLDFLGIGAQKAGTTWLYEMLKQHPQIRFPGGKEIHFWDMFQSRGLDWYQNLFAADQAGIHQGEITPAYAMLPTGQLAEIHRLFPHARLFYLIRNPLERAWSSALMALGRAEMQFEEASDQWFLDHFRSQGSLRRGDYEACLRAWQSVFPAEQILIVRHEDIRRMPREVLLRVCHHLGVDEAFREWPDEAFTQKIFAGPGHPMPPRLRAALRELYADKIMRLEAYLQQDFSGWLK